MPRPLTDYGFTSREFDGLVLEDPALFDSFIVRMVEDLDLSAQVTAGFFGYPEIIEEITSRSFRSLEGISQFSGRDFKSLESAQSGADAPEPFRSNIEPIVRTYVRGPLGYQSASLDRMTNVVTAVAYDVLSTGGQLAREEGTDVVKLRHWLPGCEHWLYPLNRFC